MAHRAHVDAAAELIELGLHHGQQHQKLALMGIKQVFSRNPMAPAYRQAVPAGVRELQTT